MKKTIALFVFLAFACSCCFAFPGLGDIFGAKSKAASSEQEILPEVSQPQLPAEEPCETSPEAEPVTEPIPNSSEEQLPRISENLEKLQASIDALEGRMTTKDTADAQADLISKIEAVSESVSALIADSEKKDAQIDTLLHEVTRVKYFANLGIVGGFKDAITPVFGATVNFGCKFKSGVTLSLGGQYFLFEGIQFKPELNLTKAQATLTVGYEW